MGEYTFDGLVEQLRSAVYEVTFTKVDGEQRVMPCTLSPEYLPESEVSRSRGDGEVNKNVVRAYAIDKQAWRSFRVENVTSINRVD